ncbi:hypothetical protein RRG08_050766 [Elysia crispata]|uniref:Uncharacterized protein n=1 Tax=Elysia crispata TaxID=231223 RepID=A0AAE0ZSJ6_9GAST|nr:hypothetical protein RRG08_050766 [Elysia crispata]
MAAAAIMMVAGAAVNALAFSGSSYFFSKLEKKDADKEQKRHDKAVEQLNAAQAQWSNRRTERLDWINKKLREQYQAVQDFQSAEAAWREYTRVTGEILDPLEPEPQLSDFYTPSSAQKDREISFVIGGMVVTGLVTYYITRR